MRQRANLIMALIQVNLAGMIDQESYYMRKGARMIMAQIPFETRWA
jgi:hypothetical protein